MIVVTCCLFHQAAVADDIGKHVEELLGYLGVCVRVDYPGALLCVQQVATSSQPLG